MNDDRSTKPTSKIRVLVGITGACVAVIAIVVLVYALTMPPSPEEVAESYIEDHYDAVAEAIVQTAFPDNPLTAEVIAEVAESIAERVIPYRCDVNKDYRATVGIRCDLSFSLDTPLELRIYAPFQVIMTTTDQDFLGRTTPVVQDANPIIDEMSVNGISLDKLTGIETKVKDVKEILDDLGLKIPKPASGSSTPNPTTGVDSHRNSPANRTDRTSPTHSLAKGNSRSRDMRPHPRGTGTPHRSTQNSVMPGHQRR